MPSDIGLKIDNRYEVVSELGRGGMGVVYKAKDMKLPRHVAIKLMTANVEGREEFHARFFAEVQTLAQFNHPNIVGIIDYGEHEGSPYMVMEFVEGTPLDKLLSKGDPLGMVVKLDYVIQVCHALGYAHQFEIIHRDVKPANVMVAKSGQQVKLLDFGIARVGKAGLGTKTSTAIGTLYYMSPEQTKGEKVDSRSDIFSLGVVLYELMTGTLPWTGETEWKVMSGIITEPYPPLASRIRNYPQRLEDIVERVLAKEVANRYQKAEDFAADLAEMQSELKEQMVADARASFETGDVLRAYDLVAEVIRVDTRNGEALELNSRLRAAHVEEKSAQLKKLRGDAEQAVGQKRYQDALESIEQAIDIHPSNTELLKYRDIIRQELRKQDEIRKKKDTVKRLEEDGDLESAYEVVEKILKLDPTDTQARMMKSQLVRRAEEEQKKARLQELSNEARQAIAERRFTDVTEALKQIEGLDAEYADLPALKQAAAEASAQEKRRRELESLIAQVQQTLNTGDTKQCLAATERALSKFPGEPALQKLRVQAEAKRDASDRKKGIQEQTDVAKQLAERGRVSEALQVAEAALKKFGSDTHLQHEVRHLREKVQQEKVEHGQKQALEQAREAMGANKFDSAVRILSAALIDFPPTPEIEKALREAREKAPKPSSKPLSPKDRQIADTLRSMLQSDPNPELQVQLAQEALRSSPDNASVQRMLSEAKERHHRVTAIVEHAQQFEASGRFEDALGQWEELAQVYPQYPQLAENMARLRAAASQGAMPAAPVVDMGATVVFGSGAAAAKPARKPAPEPAAPPPAAPPAAAQKQQAQPAAQGQASVDATIAVPPPKAAKKAAAKPAAAQPQPQREVERPKPAPKVVAPPPPEAKSKMPIFIGVAVVVIIAIAAGVYFKSAGTGKTGGTAISFDVTPPQTEVVVNDQRCVAPCQLQLAPGSYTVKAAHDGYEPAEKSFTVAAAPDTVSLSLKEATVAPSQLSISANVDQASIFVDGALKQVSKGKSTTLEIVPGRHEIQLVKQGYKSATQTVEVAKSSEAKLNFNLEAGVDASAPPQKTYLIVQANAVGAQVSVNGKELGVIGGDHKFSYEIQGGGNYKLDVTAKGFEPYSRRVNVKAGTPNEIAVSMKEIPKPNAEVVSFSATPASLPRTGGSVELRWDTRNAKEVVIDGVGTFGPTGSKQVQVTKPTAFSLTAKGEGQPASKSLSVAVAAAAPPPTIGTFEAGADTIAPGKPVKLLWDTQNTAEVSIDQGVGAVPARGSRNVSPTQTTSYTLTAKNADGVSISQTVRVNVEAPQVVVKEVAPPPTASAPTENPDHKAIRETIDRFKDAYESMSVEEEAKVWVSMPPARAKADKDVFNMFKAVRVRFQCGTPSVSGDRGSIPCTQSITFTNKGGKIEPARSAALVFHLKKTGGSWLIESMGAN